MKKAVWIWVVRVISLCVLGPLAGAVVSTLRGADGSVHATPMVSGSLMSGFFVLLGVFFLAMIGGIVATKAVSLREGVLNAGLVICWGAWGAGNVGEAMRVAPTSSSLVSLAVEGVVVLVLGVWVVMVLARVVGQHEETDECVRCDRLSLKKWSKLSSHVGMLVGIGLGVSMVMVWLQVQSGLSGQAVWGGFIGAVLAGVFGGMLIKSHSLKDENRGEDALSLVPVILGVMLGAVVGPMVSMVMPGGGKILESIAGGSAPGWMLMSSLAWCGGALVGTPVGYSWVESSVARQHAQSHAAV